MGLFCTGRPDAGLRHLRAVLALEPDDYLANFWLGLLASHARRFDEARDAAYRAYQVSGSTQALAALGYVEARSGSSSQPKPSWTPLRIPTTDTSRDQVSARFTSRWGVSIARLESGASLAQKETGN